MSTTVTINSHHALPAHEVVLLLETDSHRGLTGDAARERLEQFGPNTLPAARGAGLLLRILRQFHHPLIYVLLVAGAVTAGLREYVDSAVIFAVVLVNAIVGFIQESKAEAALQSLRAMVHTEAKVVRDGHERAIASDQLSLPVAKIDGVVPETTPVADRLNMVHSGTPVTAGSAAGIVVATGVETEIGEIHRLVGAAEVLATPLTAKLARFSKILTVGILALAAVTFAAGVLRRQDAVETFTAAVALAVGAIPEGAMRPSHCLKN